jgi:hypothetical protein
MALLLALVLSALWTTPTYAHQPFFEEQDIAFDAPWQVEDPTISTAIYAALESASDVDYFRFSGLAGQVVLLAMTIPQIEGQDDFAPTMALMGPDLPDAGLPGHVERPTGSGGQVFAPAPGPAPTFFEPFSRTSYWDRQEERVALPADGEYVVAVWHPEAQVGRYVFVVGERELPGGDPAFPLKMRRYWRPVDAPLSQLQVWWPFLLAGGLGALFLAGTISFWIVRSRRRGRRVADGISSP